MARMQRIHQELLEGRAPNCSSLARRLEVSRKTIQRDLEYMRDQLGLPIEYDAQAHGYGYTGEVRAFPSLQVSEGEVLALFVAQQALVAYQGTPFEGPLTTAFHKLASTMGDTLTVAPDELSAALSFRHASTAITTLPIFQGVSEAVLGSRELSFRYHKLNAARAEERRVQPYHLACVNDLWYLFAHDLGRDAIRTFALSRIEEIIAVGPPFTKPADFSLSDRLLKSFGVFKGEGDFAVRLEFDAFAGRLIRERHWHSSQKILELPGGALELRFRLDSLEEIERWILSWGSHVRVLGPVSLKQRVRTALAGMQSHYVDGHPWFEEIRRTSPTAAQDQIVRLLASLDRPTDAPGQLRLDLKIPRAGRVPEAFESN